MSGPLVLDAYIRVSKVAGRSGESFISPTIQRERIEAWAQLNGAEVTWHEPELDVSGGTMRRPVFDRILERVRNHETDGVIVAKLDRSVVTSPQAIGRLPVHTADGTPVPLAEVAKIEMVDGQTIVARENGVRGRLARIFRP